MIGQPHVVYREEPTSDGQTSWYSYGYPDAVYVAGGSVDELRREVRDARSWAEDAAPASRVIEHIERAMVPGVFLRVALDDSTPDREYVVSTLRAVFDQPDGQRPDLGSLVAASGDAVVICCVAGDRLAWVLEQMGDEDVVHVAMAVSDVGVCHSTLAGPRALPQPEHGGALTDLGLDETATVGEFLTATSATESSGSRPVVLGS